MRGSAECIVGVMELFVGAFDMGVESRNAMLVQYQLCNLSGDPRCKCILAVHPFQLGGISAG